MEILTEKLTQRVKAFGKKQLELKSWYPIDTEKRRKTEVEVEYYFFLPEALGVDKNTFLSNTFYQNRKIYLRFRAPSYDLETLYAGDSSRLAELQSRYVRWVENPAERNQKKLRQECQFFGAVVHSSIRSQLSRIEKLRKDTDITEAISKTLDHFTALAQSYRQWIGATMERPDDPDAYLAQFWYLDEFISLLVERYSFYLLKLTERIMYRVGKKYQPLILQITYDESEYRRSMGYPTVLESGKENEAYKYRYRALKRFFEQVFFMDVELKKESVVAEQMLMVVAAGLAMIFAMTVAFIAQIKLSLLSASFFWAMVISYMFKDRIKEISRDRLKKLFLKDAYDHGFHLFSGFGTRRFAVVKESFSFIKSKKCSKVIKEIRGRPSFNLLADGGNPERIIRYKKKVKVYSKEFDKIYRRFDVKGVTDISRISLEHFVRNITPDKDMFYVSDGEHMQEVEAHKVYHMNMVVRQRGDVFERFSHYRVILDDEGVKRIEPVKSDRKQKKHGRAVDGPQPSVQIKQ